MPETRIELLERIRSAAQAYVNAPTKFGIRHKAYRSLVKALDEHALAEYTEVGTTAERRDGSAEFVSEANRVITLDGYNTETTGGLR